MGFLSDLLEFFGISESHAKRAAPKLKPTGSKPKVFISYDHSDDRRYRDLLCAWSANSAFDFEFERCSPMTSINSEEAGVIKGQLTKMMKKADYLLVIVGKNTHKSDWIRWEIDRATTDDVNLKVVVIKLQRSYKIPKELKGIGASFAYSFTKANIMKALEEVA